MQSQIQLQDNRAGPNTFYFRFLPELEVPWSDKLR